MRALCRLWLLWLCFPLLAVAAPIGKVEVVEAGALVARGGRPEQPLRRDSALHVGDTIRVAKGNLKLRLSDGSVLMLGEGTQLTLTEAEFGTLGQERFSARLVLGSVWARVKKAAAGSERRFEIATERAVAGVRGTEFRVDVRRLDAETWTRVSVFEGAVSVRGRIQAPRLSVAMDAERISSPDAVRSAGPRRAPSRKSAPRAAAPMASAPAPAAPPAEIAAEVEAPPPTRERVLELAAKEAVLVGPADDWEPQRATEGTDPLAAFAARHRQ